MRGATCRSNATNRADPVAPDVLHKCERRSHEFESKRKEKVVHSRFLNTEDRDRWGGGEGRGERLPWIEGGDKQIATGYVICQSGAHVTALNGSPHGAVGFWMFAVF